MIVTYVHGGVSGTAGKSLPSLTSAMRAAANASNALDAVEAAVRDLEDNPQLNAGWGSTLTADGELELDAGIADGLGGATGAVAGVKVRHPITLARRVLRDTPHVLMAAPGVELLATGLAPLHDTTPEQRNRWDQARAAGRLSGDEFGAPEHVDTVGAVALDSTRRLAAGSSTGGVFGKLPGRIGDSAVFGAGFYASARVAVVGTGVGELFIESSACLRTALLVEDGAHPRDACRAIVAGLPQPGAAGLLALDSDGHVGAAYRGASWAVEGPDGAVAPVMVD